MRIAGTKYCGHDSALCLLDTDKKTVNGMGLFIFDDNWGHGLLL